MAAGRSINGWLLLVGTVFSIGIVLYYSYTQQELRRVVDNFLYWVNQALPDSIRGALRL